MLPTDGQRVPEPDFSSVMQPIKQQLKIKHVGSTIFVFAQPGQNCSVCLHMNSKTDDSKKQQKQG